MGAAERPSLFGHIPRGRPSERNQTGPLALLCTVDEVPELLERQLRRNQASQRFEAVFRGFELGRELAQQDEIAARIGRPAD